MTRRSTWMVGAMLVGLSWACNKAEPSPPAPSAQTASSAIATNPAPPDATAPAVVASVKPTQEAAAARPDGTFNVVLLLIDSMRADMPWAGYPREIAPRLTELSKKWVLYPRAYSLSSYTAKSVAPALVGKYPGEMPRNGKFFTFWPNDNVFISERAQAEGHRTLAGNGHGYFLKGVGNLNQGFDDYQLLPGTFLDTTGVADITSERLYEMAKKQLSDKANVELAEGKRFFAYFHFLDPHYTYIKHDGHPDFGKSPRDLYDNEMHYTDKWVGQLIDFIEAQPFGDRTVILISADHGEGFGERGRTRHAYDVWESLVRVPMLVRMPGASPRRIEASRSSIDIAPTVADLMGLTVEPGTDAEPTFRGKSLVPEWFGAEIEERPVYVDLPRADLMDRRRAFVDGKHKLIAFGDNVKYELFDVTVDPREEHDLRKEQPELFEQMKQKYLDFIGKIPNRPVSGPGELKGAPGGQRY